MNELALFAGAGGGILGGKLLGWRTVCAVEWDAYAASVLVARQNDKTLDPFPIWDDVQTFDGRPWKGRVDVVSGGFPCQDISCAGKGAGIEGERSGMWGEMARIVGEVQPRFVFVENSPMLVGRGLTRVISDLAQMGYDARWGIVGAHHVSAPHKRDRIWIVAYTKKLQCDGSDNNTRNLSQSKTIPESRNDGGESDVADSDNNGLASTQKPRSTVKGSDNCSTRSQQTSQSEGLCASRSNKDVADSKMPDDSPMQDQKRPKKRTQGEFGRSSSSGTKQSDVADSDQKGLQGSQCPRGSDSQGWQKPNGSTAECSGLQQPRKGYWASEPELGRVAHGVAHRVDRLKCIGNGQVPQVAALAWQLLTEDLNINNQQ